MTEPVTGENDSLRLFFALWPDDATRDALARTGKWLHKHWGGRRMRDDTLHLTLAFLGRTPVAQLDTLLAYADSIEADAFDLTLTQPGYWRHNRIGWFGPAGTATPLEVLVTAVGSAVRASGLNFDERPHVPHVTLLRDSDGGPPPICTPVVWPVTDFVLVASRGGGGGAYYDIVRRWSLKAVR